MKARDYQHLCLDAVEKEFEVHDNTLAVMPTGSGKTIVFAMLAERVLERNPGMRAIVLAHRKELIEQACHKIKQATKLTTEIEMAELRAVASSQMAFNKADVLVSSIQTQIAGKQKKRMTKFDPFEFALAIADEAHHSTASSWTEVINYYRRNEGMKLLGVTATPDRSDEAALGRVFDSVAFCYEIQDAMRDGWLVPILQKSIEIEGLDYDVVRKTAGELNGKQLESVLIAEEPIHGMVRPSLEELGDKKALCFCVTKDHAIRMCEIFNRYKPGCATYVTDDTEKKFERPRRFKAFADGEYQIMCNVGVATEGYDEWTIEAIIMARPVLSRGLFAQMVGRGTRPQPGVVDAHDNPADRRNAIANSYKPNVTIYDFVGNCTKHKLRHTADLLGGNYDEPVVARARKMIEESGGTEDVENMLDRAAKIIESEIEEERRRHIRAMVKYRVEIVNPFDVMDIRRDRPRDYDIKIPATETQNDFLKSKGVKFPDGGFSKRDASKIIGEIIERSRKDLATYKQVQKLMQNGHPDPHSLTFKEATVAMSELAANNWRAPDSWMIGTNG